MSDSSDSSFHELIDSFAKIVDPNGCSWEIREDRKSITHQLENITLEIINKLDIKTLIDLAARFGDSLNCYFSVSDAPGLEISIDINQTMIDNFIKENDKIELFYLNFKLDKEKFLRSNFGKFIDHVDYYLFIFPSALVREFCNLFSGKEDHFWSEVINQRVIIFVPDVDISLSGDLLQVIGGHFITEPENITFQQNHGSDYFVKVNEKAQEMLRWQKPWVRNLTPYHLFVHKFTTNNYLLVNAIQSQFVNLFLLFTADRTLEHNDTFLSTYSGSKYTLDVSWNFSKNDESQLYKLEDLKCLYNTLEWVYNPTFQSSDRIPLVQIDLVSSLKGSSPEVAKNLIVNNALGNFKDLDEQWTIVIENRVDTFADRKEKLLEEVITSVNKFTNQVTEFTAELTKSALALVGVLIGTFFAALFKDGFNETIFTYGMYIYAGYLFLFPLVFNMWNQMSRFLVQESLFNNNKKIIANQLEASTVNQIIGNQIEKAKSRFFRWYIGTIIVYGLLIFCVLMISSAGPKWVASSTLKETPIPTLSVTPTSPPKPIFTP